MNHPTSADLNGRRSPAHIAGVRPAAVAAVTGIKFGMVRKGIAIASVGLGLWLLSPSAGFGAVTFNGAVTNQVIDGFGANINHRGWNNDELKPALDALMNQAGMTMFRIIYEKADWEGTNDNADPTAINWNYYNSIYSSADFQKMWDLVAYLNQKGISNSLILNFQGNGPAWLGGSSLTSGLEAEWAEMVGSLLIYARQTKHLQFGLVGPDNELDQSIQGIGMTVTQYTNALGKLFQLLDTNGLSDIRYVGPDFSCGGTNYMPEILANPFIMAHLGHFGIHSYNEGGGSVGVYNFLQASAYPDRNFWTTEFNVWCSLCDYDIPSNHDWTYCKGTAEYLMQHLLNNTSAGIVWDGYDSQYNILGPGVWGFWGLLAVDDTNATVKTYTPRKNFYTLAQITKWVRPGAQRIDVSGTTSPFYPLLAFKHSALGQVTIVGINNSTSAAALSGTLASLPTVTNLVLYYTTAATNLARGNSVGVSNGAFNLTIPGDCVFTLTGGTSAPRITAFNRNGQGLMQMTVSGQTGVCYVLESSSNLFNWNPADAKNNNTGAVVFVGSPMTNLARFFRARSTFP
jgi:hypothetical protein